MAGSLTFFLASKAALNYVRATSSFSTTYSSPIQVPRESKACYVKVLQADIWNLVANVSPALGNVFTVEVNSVAYTLTISTGQYSFQALSSAIQNELKKVGVPANALEIGANAATQKIVLQTAIAGTTVSFAQPSSLYKILGYNLGDTVVLAAAGVEYEAPNIAQFNVINSFLVHSDLTTDGIPVNGDYTQTVAKVPITVGSGSLIAFTPAYPIPVPCPGLIGHSVNEVRLWLTTEDGATRVDTQEDYSVLLEISWT